MYPCLVSLGSRTSPPYEDPYASNRRASARHVIDVRPKCAKFASPVRFARRSPRPPRAKPNPERAEVRHTAVDVTGAANNLTPSHFGVPDRRWPLDGGLI